MTNSTEHLENVPEGEDWEDVDDTNDPDPDEHVDSGDDTPIDPDEDDYETPPG